jgi:flagellar basal-body rod modification protein FlgD
MPASTSESRSRSGNPEREKRSNHGEYVDKLSDAGNAECARPVGKQHGIRHCQRKGERTITGSASSLGTTFLSLLAQELQNQDPTSPVDPTQMVGQMISLNQLEQLIGINQTLKTTSGTTTTTKTQATNATTANTQLASRTGSAANTLSPSAAGAATSQLPFDPNTMLPLGFANSGAAAASINSYLNPVSMGTSGTTSNATGGK